MASGKHKAEQRTPSTQRASGAPADAAARWQPSGASQGCAGFSVVGVGASAGGSEAFIELLRALPADTGMAFVLVQHLSPSRASALAELLSRATTMPVSEVADESEVEPNRVYVIPPGRNMVIEGGHLQLLPREAHGKQHPIDQFFSSLAHSAHQRAIGVVLSGAATDGTLGLQEIKAQGGITFAQDESAPASGIRSGARVASCVDFMLPPEGIAAEIARIAAHPYLSFGQETQAGRPESSHATSAPTELDTLLELLRFATNIDFTHHKASTIARRIGRRMVLLELAELADYAALLREDPAEVQALCRDLLTNVTRFFRDPEMFALLGTSVLPELLAQRSASEPVRVWVPGCATGEEAYSLAMLFLEAAEGSKHPRPAQIFATDPSAANVEQARAGVYSKEQVRAVSDERLERFFVEVDSGFQISKAVREMCVFSRHDVMSDPPFSRIDLISCRNLSNYSELSLQERLVPALHYSLKRGGLLALGGAEMIGSFGEHFTMVDREQELLLQKQTPGPVLLPHRAARIARAVPSAAGAATRSPSESGAPSLAELAEREMIQHAPPAVLVDQDLQIQLFRGDTEPYLVPAQGRASHALLKMVREGLLGPVRELLERARKERTKAVKQGLRVRSGAGARVVDLEVIPLAVQESQALAFLILFKDAQQPEVKALEARAPHAEVAPSLEPETPSATIRRLEQELQQSREHAQAQRERHEAAIEELQWAHAAAQAANEEAVSANEELQSINEELDTSKEEIQSSNEELTTLNDEMQVRNVELGQLNNDLANLVEGVNIPIVIVGRDLRIRRFSPMAEKLLGLLRADVGRPITRLRADLGLPDLEQLLGEVVRTAGALEREIKGKDGRWYSLRLRPYLTSGREVDGAVLMLLDVEALRQAREYAESIVATVREPLVVLDESLRVQSASRAFYAAFGLSRAETEGRAFHELAGSQWNIPELRRLLENVVTKGSVLDDFLVEHDVGGKQYKAMLLNARSLVSAGNESESILLAIEDVTQRRRADRALKLSETRYRRLFESAKDGILILDAETAAITDANPFVCELLGYSFDELLGKQLWQIGLFKDEDESKAVVQELQEKRYVRYADLPLKTKTGTQIEVEVVSNLYLEGDHDVMQCNIRDMTERKRLEADLRQRNEELAVADTAKNDFIAMLSHELRSPLNAICGWTQVLRHPLAKSEDIRIGLEVIDRSSRAQAQLINDLMDSHRIASGKVRLELTELELNALVGAVVHAMMPAASEKHIQIETDVDPEPVIISGDSTRIQQVLSNLLGNALKFTPDGGHIRVSLHRSGGRAELVVHDTGQGISPGAMPNIFERFRQSDPLTSRHHAGLGLGLAISKQLVELHGGRITAHSAGSGQGATFTVSLPLLLGERSVPVMSSDAPAERSSISLTGLLVLVVDDEVDAREPLRRVLEEAGAETVAVHSAHEALRAVRRRRPDVIVSDICMPEHDGYELLESLRALPEAQGGRVPAIALTAYATTQERERALAVGFQAHLAKPIRSEQLLTVVAELTRSQRAG